VRFTHGEWGGAAAGTSNDDDKYRAFRPSPQNKDEGTCYELMFRSWGSAYEIYAPGTVERFTAADQKRLQQIMDRILHSFRFLK
jgi:hypothetical protein